jgi:hypothetical protein
LIGEVVRDLQAVSADLANLETRGVSGEAPEPLASAEAALELVLQRVRKLLV